MSTNKFILGLFLSFILAVGDTAAADGESSQSSQYAEKLQSLVREGEEKAKLQVLASAPAERRVVTGSNFSSQKMAEIDKEADPNQTILNLVDQVEKLKSKEVVSRQNALNLHSPKRSMHVGSKTVYPFIEGKLYEVHAGVDKITDISLEAGEKLLGAPMAGDTIRWKVGLLTSGGKEETSHVIIKPLESDLETNLIITTNKRIYHIRLLSSDWYMPSVAWEYPQEEKSMEELLAEKRAIEEEEPIGLAPEKLRFDYEMDGDRYAWKPQVIFDDGSKTYLQVSEKAKGDEAPALFILSEDNEPMLVNYRVKGRFYIVDRLFEKAELRIGQEKVITITSPLYEKSFFERVF